MTVANGVEIFIIANADTVMSRSSASLAAEVYPNVPITRPLGEHETLPSIDKARRVLGYEPQHRWFRHNSPTASASYLAYQIRDACAVTVVG
ncbi:hypothetical protein [Actinoplanes sp. NPDC026619]|uniref:hypothetical protein n=1 Tax=Actinoplanes sp. NPDC026619 TaxID=3155798 RepID=UPI0033E20E8A